jgi:cell division protein FtsB
VPKVTEIASPPSATKAIVAATKRSVTIAALEAEIERLQAEVKKLKRLLAERSGGRPLIGDKAMSGTERAQRSRAKSKAGKQHEFRG